MNTTTYSKRPRMTLKTAPVSAHPAQEAVEGLLARLEGSHTLSVTFTRDNDSMKLFSRNQTVAVGFICTLYDEDGVCLSQGRGLSFVGYHGEKYVQKAILYARNASLIDCAMRASKVTAIFPTDTESLEGRVDVSATSIPEDNKPSERQISYLKRLIENDDPEEQDELLSKLPQMTKYDVSQLINQLTP